MYIKNSQKRVNRGDIKKNTFKKFEYTLFIKKIFFYLSKAHQKPVKGNLGYFIRKIKGDFNQAPINLIGN